MVTLTIKQPAEGAPEGKPFGVRWRDARGARVQWFATENEAWSFRDEVIELRGQEVRVIGAPCHVVGTAPAMSDRERAAFRDGRPATYPLGWDHI